MPDDSIDLTDPHADSSALLELITVIRGMQTEELQMLLLMVSGELAHRGFRR
jgi:hypothetical protein